ncbi:MAG: tetratricopeptide repeat protein [Alphaproteobacteria bacterium]|nr:tetratricopeptide repeat protein [Alphaproteobacteria bacterium]
MQENDLIFPQGMYSAYLTILNGIKLSNREIDIISCILNGRSAKGIAHLLSIAPKTVETHTYNVMKKLDCPSRESLISLVEKSDKLLLFKRYYLRLLSYLAFEQTLKNISKLGSNEEKSCIIVCWREERTIALVSQIKTHLELAGTKVSLEVREDGESSLHAPSKKQLPYCTLYALPKEWVEKREKFSAFFEKLSSLSSNILFFGFDKETLSYISHSIPDHRYINFAEKENYYFSVFTVLKRLFPQSNFDPLVEEFKKKNQFMTYSSEVISPLRLSTPQKRFMVSHLKWLLIALLIVCGGGLTHEILRESLKEKDPFSIRPEASREATIRSDFNLPNERILLKRAELVSQIDDKLKSQAGIQTIALIGMGGAGKTTLARHYVHQQKASVIWEINAETHESLQESFDRLAQALARTEEDQKKLRELQGIKDSTEREEKVLQFVKGHLKASSNWILLYDNVETLADIQKYFPQDVATWGQGKIILTTRNSNVQNNKHVNFSLSVGELSPAQKLDLFSSIMNNEASSPLTPQQVEEAKTFLESIPSFPLDISIAAYYLKSSNISYDQYLKNLIHYNQNFEKIQEDILKEAGDYTNTRYAIIILSLQKLIESHKDFKDILLFISLIDSQNIPRELLEIYKNSTTIDNFIHHLKKYSLITHEFAPSSISTFSIHRSTQEIILAYLIRELNLVNNKQLLNPMIISVEKYIDQAIEQYDFMKIKLFSGHCEAFLRHKNLLDEAAKIIISGELGYVYYVISKGDPIFLLKNTLVDLKKTNLINTHFMARILSYLGICYWGRGNFEKSENLLEESLRIYKKYPGKDFSRISRALTYLGILYSDKGDQEKAKDLFEQSLNLYKNHNLENGMGCAFTLAQLGNIQRKLGHYEKAKSSLEKSLSIYEKNSALDHIDAGWAQTILGWLYSDCGDFKAAKELHEKTLIIYKKHFPENSLNVAWALRNVGNDYSDLGESQMALKLLEQSFKTFRTTLGNDNIKTKWMLYFLGEAYRDMKDTKKAKDAFEECLKAYEMHYGKEHVQSALILQALGKTYLLENNLEISEKFLQKALEIHQKENHPYVYAVLENLSEVYAKKSKQAGNDQESQLFEKKAIDYLKQALQIIKTRFPENSPHTTRIQSKLENLTLMNE